MTSLTIPMIKPTVYVARDVHYQCNRSSQTKVCNLKGHMKSEDVQTQCHVSYSTVIWGINVGDGPNTVSESTVSNTEHSDLFCSHRLPGRELRGSFQPIIAVPMQTHRFVLQSSLCLGLSGHHSLFSVHMLFRRLLKRPFMGFFRNENAKFTESFLCSRFTI